MAVRDTATSDAFVAELPRILKECQMQALIELIGPLDESAMRAAREPRARLAKPAGSLGALDELSIRSAGAAKK